MNAIETAIEPTTSTAPTTRQPKVESRRNGYRPLHELPPGGHGVVHEVHGSDAALLRLMAMGLCVGREVEIVRQGNPLIVRLLGARVGVSERLARNVVIERCQCARCVNEEIPSVA